MLNVIKKYEISLERINKLRFEVMRIDEQQSGKKRGLMQGSVFRSLLKRFSFSVSAADQKIIDAFFKEGVPQPLDNGYMNIKQLNRLVEHLSRVAYQNIVSAERENPKEDFSRDIVELIALSSTKLKLAFHSPEAAFRFFDVSQVRFP